jgi:hypothetical protein
VCAAERRELSLPAAAGGLKTMGYGRMATHRPGGVLPGGHSPSEVGCDHLTDSFICIIHALGSSMPIYDNQELALWAHM